MSVAAPEWGRWRLLRLPFCSFVLWDSFRATVRQLVKILRWLGSGLTYSPQHPFEVLCFPDFGNWPMVTSWKCWELSQPSLSAVRHRLTLLRQPSKYCLFYQYVLRHINPNQRAIVPNGSPGMPCQKTKQAPKKQTTKTEGICWICKVSKKILVKLVLIELGLWSPLSFHFLIWFFKTVLSDSLKQFFLSKIHLISYTVTLPKRHLYKTWFWIILGK